MLVADGGSRCGRCGVCHGILYVINGRLILKDWQNYDTDKKEYEFSVLGFIQNRHKKARTLTGLCGLEILAG
ncbi:hypothetical protein [Moraxella lacunata]|uniref:hypothetical protein n=1 Tax=Moraxella lacunata TaxID=477 RepID=UPI003EE19112